MNLRACLLLLVTLEGTQCLANNKTKSQAAPETRDSRPAGQQLASLLQAKRPVLTFRPDDVLSVQVYGVKDYNVEQRVAEDGTVSLPFVGRVQAAGRTVQQLQSTVADLLARGGIIKDPQVTVLSISQPWVIVTVAGDVAKPGIYPAYGNLTLLDFLSEAGGLNENVVGNAPVNSPASSTIVLVRPSMAEPISIPLGADPKSSPYAAIPLFPGDQIRVAHVGVVYAVGAFKTEGAYPLKSYSPTTLLQVVAMAGGIGYQADRKDAHLIRLKDGKRYIVDLDVPRILKGELADVPLEPDDILFVPTNTLRAAIKGGGSGVIVSLASAYLYTHP